jgi:hypothetical protein
MNTYMRILSKMLIGAKIVSNKICREKRNTCFTLIAHFRKSCSEIFEGIGRYA